MPAVSKKTKEKLASHANKQNKPSKDESHTVISGQVCNKFPISLKSFKVNSFFFFCKIAATKTN